MREIEKYGAEIYGVEKGTLFKNLHVIEMNNEFFIELHFLCMQSVAFYPVWYFSASLMVCFAVAQVHYLLFNPNRDFYECIEKSH